MDVQRTIAAQQQLGGARRGERHATHVPLLVCFAVGARRRQRLLELRQLGLQLALLGQEPLGHARLGGRVTLGTGDTRDRWY